MKPGSVIVDIAIDQGGCAETSRPTTHSEPTYVEHGVVHYCVTNMPGATARTSTLALTQATLPLALELADKGYARALLDNPGLRDGLNVCRGQVTHPRCRRRSRLAGRSKRFAIRPGTWPRLQGLVEVHSNAPPQPSQALSQSLQSPTNVVFAPAAVARRKQLTC